jgi:hypothetical protein
MKTLGAWKQSQGLPQLFVATGVKWLSGDIS